MWYSTCDTRSHMTMCSTNETPTPVHSETCVRIMRWTFRREEETLVCELGLSGDDSAYELRIASPWNPFGATTELFDDAMSAFQRHTALERELVRDGWSLESFRSDRVSR
jgi:hypothetical protein